MILIEKTISSKYRNNSHFVFCCTYHVIFSPKYRRKVLSDDIAIRLKEIFIETSQKYNCNIIEMEIMEDHVHMIIDCDPSFGISNIIKKLKGTSANILRKEFPSLKKRLPCLWTRSSFVSTVGSVSLEIVKQYIENQKGK